MSIKGFKVNNQTEKYDYEALDNLPDIDGSVMKKALDVSVTTSGTNNGVTFTNNGDGTWSLSGTASSSDPARKYFVYSPTSIPSWLDETKTLFINFNASDSTKVHATVGFYYNGASTAAESVGIYEPSYVRIPDGITGISILFFVAKGTEVNNVTVNEFDVMYASELDPVAYQLKNSFAASMLPSTFSRVDKGANLNSILDYPANFINSMASTEARTLLSEIDFPENFSLGSSTTSVTIVGFSISNASTQYLVMTVNGSYVYLGFHNHITGLKNWSDIKGSKRRIRVLNIGHSGGQDVLAYTPYVIERIAPDVEFDLGLAYLSSATIDMMHTRIGDNTIKDIEFDYKDHASSSWVNSARDKSLADILAQGPWDVILFEQASAYEATWSSFHNLGKLIDAVSNWHRATFGSNSKCKIGWVQVGPNPQRAGVTFEGVIDCIHRILRSTQVEFVIPAGTATRVNALTNAKLVAIGNQGNMMADVNGHLQEGIPVLIGSYVSAMKILEVCGCGNRSVNGDAFWPTQEWVNGIHSPGQNGTCVPTGSRSDSENIGVIQAAQKAAIAAIKYPERATKIDYYIDLNDWSDPYPNNLSVNDEIAVQAYSNFTLSSKRWDVNMALGDSDALGHTQNFKIIPGSDYYIGTIGYVNNGVMGCFLNANEMPLQPLRSSDCSEFSYPYLTDNPNTDLTQYAKLYKFTAPDDAYYLSLNWTLTTSEHWKFFFSNIPMFREGNSGDIIVYENDPMRHKKNKKLCVVGPSYAMIDRRKQTNYGNKYVVGFQEYLYPFYDSITTFGYSGGTWGQMRDDTYISIYSGIVTGYGASVLPKDFTPYDEVLLIGCNPNGFFTTPRQEEGTAGTFDTNTSAVSTFMGGLRGVVEYILNQKPNMKIYLSNFWHCSGTSAAYRETCENLNAEMLKLSNLFGLQYIDMYNGTPFNKWNYTSSNTIYTYDGTHPNNDAMREIADVLVRNMI